MTTDTNYPFLNAITESDAVTRGVSLSDRVLHAVYKTVKVQTTLKNARHNALFHIDMSIPDLVNITKKDLVGVLRKLIGEQLIVPLFYLDYDVEKRSLFVSPCYVATNEEDKHSIYDLYLETVARSVASVEAMLESIPTPTAEEIWQDFMLDLNSEKIPAPKDLPSTIVDLLASVHAGNFPLIPHSELLRMFRRDLLQELIKRGHVAEIPGYGILPIKSSEMLLRFEAAADFLTSHVIPRYKNNATIRRDLDQIELEEATYYLDEFAAQSPDFAVRRAQVIKRASSGATSEGGGGADAAKSRFPGYLAMETLLQLERGTRERYREKQKSDNLKSLGDLKKRLMDPRASWSEMVFFIKDEDYSTIHPDVRESLAADKDILYGKWEEPEETIHVYLRNDPFAFRSLVAGMSDLSSDLYWQVLAMRQLLDRYDEHFEELFDDAEFLRLYGKLLRRVYLNYMPWFHRLLIAIGINLFQDRAFMLAKAKIQQEQNMRSLRNVERGNERRKKREMEKRESVARLHTVSGANRILEKLDYFYLEQGRIPSLHDVKSVLPDMDESVFRELLVRERFQTVPTGRDESPDDAILVYPVNHEWRVRVARLRRVLDRILTELEAKGAGDFESKLFLERARKLKAYLGKKEKAVSRIEDRKEGEEDGTDAYARFEKEVRNYESRTQTMRGEGGEGPDEIDM